MAVAGLGGGQGSEGLQVTGTSRRLSGCEADSLPTPSRVAILWVTRMLLLPLISLSGVTDATPSTTTKHEPGIYGLLELVVQVKRAPQGCTQAFNNLNRRLFSFH